MSTPIDYKELHLSAPTPLKVSIDSSPQYHCYLTHNGTRIKLKSLAFKTNGMRIYSRKDKLSVVVPTDDWLRSQLDELEKFVMENVTIPNDVSKMEGGVGEEYKALYRGNPMSINVSQWCKYRMMQEDGTIIDVPLSKLNQPGTITFELAVPYVYIGNLANGKCFSLTLFITELLLEPPMPTTSETKMD